MKQILFSAFLMLMGATSFSQSNRILGSADTIQLLSGSYEFNNSLPAKISSQKSFQDGNTMEITKGQKVRVLYEKDKLVYFQYWNFTDSVSYKKLNKDLFSLPNDEFKTLTVPLYRRYKGATVGAYSVPFRLRGVGSSDFDYESSLSLQANVVFGFGNRYKKESWFDGSFGMGLTGVNLNSKNSIATEDRTASAFTLSLGGIIKPSRFANIGVFMGWDFLGQKDREVEWKHNEQSWLGLGINISFNEVKTDKPATGTN